MPEPQQPDNRALVALGANLPSSQGSPAQTLEAAFRALQALSEAPLLRSGLWQSEPEHCPPGSPLFVNAAAVLQVAPGLSSLDLLGQLQAIESRFGRQRGAEVNAPRVLDLDLISHGGVQCDEPALMLPHPRAHLRAFVLLPLAEIVPELVLPGQTCSIAVLAQRVSVSSGVQRIGDSG